jgi:hypothetical protein
VDAPYVINKHSAEFYEKMSELGALERAGEEESMAYFKELIRNSPYPFLHHANLSGLNFFGHSIWVSMKGVWGST